MKILLSGGGTGGHIYPLFAIAEALNAISDEEKFINFKLYFASDTPYDKDTLERLFITYVPITAGKLRVYFSFKNIVDVIKTGFGVVDAVWKLYKIYPDVVISKGGYASFPVLLSARILRIPVIIHESDTVPGRVNLWAGKFAKKIAVSFPEAIQYFDKEKTAITGQPVRQSIVHVPHESACQFFDIDPTVPTIGVFAGSQGAKVINDAILRILPELLEKYQVIHQVGEKTFEEVKKDVGVILEGNTKRNRYKAFSFLNDVQTKMLGGASMIIIGRSGSSLFEIAAWGKPSILIPYAIAHGDHQRKNAYHYARTGACVVVEEANLTPSVLLEEIETLISNTDRYTKMAEHAKAFYTPDASRTIAIEAVKIALEHEK